MLRVNEFTEEDPLSLMEEEPLIEIDDSFV
jgi:hypothetical protein